jgi:hypothetical protein
MSGVVNRTVAEKAMAVKADELIRKPFQPQDLIVRVKNLLNPKRATSTAVQATPGDSGKPPRAPAQALTGLFSPAPAAAPPLVPAVSRVNSSPVAVATPRADAVTPAIAAPASRPVPQPAAAGSADIQRLRNDILRLELLVKKLRAELEAEHQYCAALEAHFKALQQSR